MIEAHREWLGYVQPVGMVVAPAALVRRGVVPDRHVAPAQQRLLDVLERDRDERLRLVDPMRFFVDVLGWDAGDLVTPTAELTVSLPELGETLRARWAVREPEPEANAAPWQLLIAVEPDGTDLDAASAERATGWHASPQARFERLLRETEVPTGLLLNGRVLRLVHAPRGETSGHITFGLDAMAKVAGRPILASLLMLLEAPRLFTLPREVRLPALLVESRKAQAEVSVALSGQVLAALHELLRGLNAGDARANSTRIADLAANDPQHLYGGLLTALMRLVFVLYAEDRGLMSGDPVYVQHYSVGGLFQRLRADAALYPDTMDHRFGAWAQLLALWRVIHRGGDHAGFHLAARRGRLFDPDRYAFLEGRDAGSTADELPPVPDGTVWRILEKLMMLDGERLSYRTLDVEQIGSVYEAIMGFTVERAGGRSIAVKPQKAGGAAAVVDLDALLTLAPVERLKRLAESADRKLSGAAELGVKQAASVGDFLAALEKFVDRASTPHPVAAGTPVLQPTDERRRSGSHYTPRSLTEPIVREALRPVLERIGARPTPGQILDLKVLDPAMGSGAFLVEACRQLAEALVAAWTSHGETPPIPLDEDELLHARRLVAQRCLYGLDKNAMAVDLARLSLWLATLARDHEFTFVDHALRHGDALVGLTKRQIAAMHWKPAPNVHLAEILVRDRIAQADAERRRIREAVEELGETELRPLLDRADQALNDVRLLGDAVVASYLTARQPDEREQRRTELVQAIELPQHRWSEPLHHLSSGIRRGNSPVPPFHWELEFPEVFGREDPGFDLVVGNPPFLGGTLIGGRLGLSYHDFLAKYYEPATGLADLISFFFRRAYMLCRSDSALGLIATNTIAQGDTRKTSLEQILTENGTIYHAQRRLQWPGNAAVVVSVLHIAKGTRFSEAILDNKNVPRISAYLLPGMVDKTPEVLEQNRGVCFGGTKIWGAGFVFDEMPTNGSSSLDDMRRLIVEDPRNHDVIFRYLGGEDFNSSPTLSPMRFVINFGNMSEAHARQWPSLFSIVEERVRPVRATNKQRNYREKWWRHANRVDELEPYLRRFDRVLAITCVSQHVAFGFVEKATIIQNSMIVMLLNGFDDFAVLQSHVHETWARLVGTTLKSDLRYNTTCFDSFPRPKDAALGGVSEVGDRYYKFRADLMIKNSEGLTKTYNRFNDPEEGSAGILRLRELHHELDRAVLDAYGWSDLFAEYGFEVEWEDNDDEGARRRKPWRYRWVEATRDEVLARLLELNRTRAEQDVLLRPPSLSSHSPRRNRQRARSSPDLLIEL